MKHLFVPYELAVKLKEKGFDEHVLALSSIGGNGKPIKEPLYEYVKSYKSIAEGWIKLPLYQQVIDWLDQKHLIKITCRMQDVTGMWFCEIWKFHDKQWLKQPYSVQSIQYLYEAQAKAIEHALTLIP